MGIAVAQVSLIGLFFTKKRFAPYLKIISLVLLILIFITGHYGGTLTHGEGYITKTKSAVVATKTIKAALTNTQELVLYTAIIQPILEEKCYGCHSQIKQKGKLRLDGEEWILKGGKDGVIIHAGDPQQSALYHNITLDPLEEKHMPPKGKPQITEEERVLLEWWINTGASFNKKIKDLTQPIQVKSILTSLEKNNQQVKTTEVPSEKLRERLLKEFLADYAPYQQSKAVLDRASRQLSEAKIATGTLNVMVLAERKEPRPTYVLQRGNWDKHGQEVQPGVPGAIAPWMETEERTRAGLARWITSPRNPLAARVAVNHLWQMLFGQGLVRTTEDFGLQGERPSHPELLDWLAVDLMEHGWDLKHTLEIIATSATYRQSSAAAPSLWTTDPDNRLLARGARFRLPSWMLRDSALRASGLINDAVGGAPVRPYQPEGVWEELFMGRFKYEPSDGNAQFRRTLYAFWRRSIAPTFLFDSAQRRTCEVRTGRTNTPLQALTLLNDGTFMEAARELARQMIHVPETQRLEHLYQHVLSRNATPKEHAILQNQLEKALAYYKNHPQEAWKFLQFGQRLPEAGADLPALAAYTLIASLTINLDESITHE
ncbi:MAG: DUF1553 domain-containing protein [Verrucomicrobiota bacterium]